MAENFDNSMASKVFGSEGVLKVTVGVVALGLLLFVTKRRRGKDQPEGSQAEAVTEVELSYLSRLEAICRFGQFPPNTASKVLDFLYLGATNDAANPPRLAELGITHVINCAHAQVKTGAKFYGDSMKYLGFEAQDDWGYDIMQHFNQTFSFIEEARKAGGKVLIHCQMGVNRSGALATAYIMVHKNIGPLSAARLVINARKLILTNDYFQRQLIQLANKRGLLELDKNEVQAAAHM